MVGERDAAICEAAAAAAASVRYVLLLCHIDLHPAMRTSSR